MFTIKGFDIFGIRTMKKRVPAVGIVKNVGRGEVVYNFFSKVLPAIPPILF